MPPHAHGCTSRLTSDGLTSHTAGRAGVSDRSTLPMLTRRSRCSNASVLRSEGKCAPRCTGYESHVGRCSSRTTTTDSDSSRNRWSPTGSSPLSAPARRTRRTPARGVPHRRGPLRAEVRHAPHARPPTPRPTRESGPPDAPRPRGDGRRARPSPAASPRAPPAPGHRPDPRPNGPRETPARWRARRRPLTGAREAGDRGLCSAHSD